MKKACSKMLLAVLPLIINVVIMIDANQSLPAIILFNLVIYSEFVVVYCAIYQEHKKKNKGLKEQIKILEDQKKDIINYYKNEDQNANGNNLLYMALTQHPAEPMRISLLKKSADKYKNPMAAIILASIYRYGVERNGVLVFKADPDAAYNLYAQFAELDASGLCDWQMGYYYQSRAEKAIKNSNESNELFIKARECYEISLAKGFPKAKNSIGNLIVDNRAGFDKLKNLSIMLEYYRKASEEGDVYATINSGHYFYDKVYKEKGDIKALDTAKMYYENARKMDSPQGTLYDGMIELELNRAEGGEEHLLKAKEAMCSCISYGNNQFSAVAYCLLGNMFSKHPEQMDDTNVKLVVSSAKDDKAYIACYQKAYHIFSDLISKGESLSGKSEKYYDLLKNSFENITTELFS